MFYRIGFITRTIAALLAAVGVHSTVQAAIYTVGSPSGPGQPCTHGTIQSAINAANSNPGADTVRLTRSLTYQPEANIINTSQELTIEGGYATCTQAAPDTTNTVISGVGGAAAPVFTITAPTGAWIRMRRLTISGGDVSTTGQGGGIRFSGNGILEIQDSLISNNTAGYGGGIYAEGTGSNAELVLGANVVISNNTARYDGGGLLAHGIEMSMVDPGSWIYNNQAQGTNGTGYGGGLLVRAANRPSYAYIGSGTGLLGAILGNTARYGGGVAVTSQGTDAAELQLFTTNPAYQAYVGGNSASVLGGGLYLNSSQARARLWNAVLDNNDAPNGAAAYLASNSGLYVNFAAMPPGAANCTIGVDCGRITNNTANADANPGAIVYGESGTTLQFGYLPTAAPSDPRGGVVIQNNTAASVFGGAATTQIHRSIIGNNTTSSDVIKLSGNPFYLIDSTIVGNAIGGGSAILRMVDSAVMVQRSILWQPGRTVLSRSGGSVAVERSVVNENAGLGAGASTFDPRFVDPTRGDYGLRAGSRAVDYALALPGNERDAYGQPRDTDLLNPDQSSPRDIGALERQSLQPMVLNGDFDTDLRLWWVWTGDRDASQNASGSANSGSLRHVGTATSGSSVTVAKQCVFLPAPGTYRLTGWGKGSGSTLPLRSYPFVVWTHRTNGSESCDTGAVTSTGQFTLAGGTSWAQPGSPAIIDVPVESFGPNSSIEITLMAAANSLNGAVGAWFDGITLDIAPQGSELFADGFEGCPPARGEACR